MEDTDRHNGTDTRPIGAWSAVHCDCQIRESLQLVLPLNQMAEREEQQWRRVISNTITRQRERTMKEDTSDRTYQWTHV